MRRSAIRTAPGGRCRRSERASRAGSGRAERRPRASSPPAEVLAERAADPRLVAALSGGRVAGDGAPERPRRRLLLALGTENGGASLGGRRRARPAVPETGDLL